MLLLVVVVVDQAVEAVEAVAEAQELLGKEIMAVQLLGLIPGVVAERDKLGVRLAQTVVKGETD